MLHHTEAEQAAEMDRLREEIELSATSEVKVLLSGHRDAGKDLVARAIHRRGPRSSKPFVHINCADLAEAVLETELFGSATAVGSARGAFELADQGTIFVDEISELSDRLQGRLFQFLETGVIQKAGTADPPVPANVRVIAGTSCNLRERVAHGRFREELFYRLNVVHIPVPFRPHLPIDAPRFVDART